MTSTPIPTDQCATPTERVARLTFLLAKGATPTTAEAAVLVNLCNSGAYRMLDRMSLSIPLVQEGGRWSLLTDK